MLGVIRQPCSRLKSDAVIVHPEIRRVRMRNIDRNQRNSSRRNLICDDGRYLLLDLEFDYQIYVPLNKFLGIPHSGFGVVLIVHNDEFNPHPSRCFRKALGVLIGDMSLVGARPKLPIHQLGKLGARPGITGAATIAFAREEAVLARLPLCDLNGYYNDVILPIKHEIDQEYMARATFASDFRLLVDTVLRRWDTSLMESLLADALLSEEDSVPVTVASRNHVSLVVNDRRLDPEEQLTEA